MNVRKKLIVLALALVAVLALSVSALATAEDLAGDGIVGDFTDDAVQAKEKTVKIYKEFTVYNPASISVRKPEVTYEYTITAGDANKDIYDATTAHAAGVSVNAKTIAGAAGATISNIVLDTDATWNASSSGTSNKESTTIDFSNAAFNRAGVYRYVITETTTTATKNAAGINEGTTPKVLYLDVYVKDGTSSGTYDIYGYVCFTNNNNIDARADATDTVANAAKIEGFVIAGSATADSYYTFNFTVGKTVTGDQYTANAHHEFPFTVKLDNSTVTAKVLPIMTVGTNATQTALSEAAIGTGANATTWSPTIAHGATVEYVGIPCGTTVTITETNNLTGVTYNSSSAGADTDATGKAIGNAGTSNAATITTTALQAAADNKTVTFTNALVNISPTGVSLRYAPYLLTLGAGIVALPMTRSYKKREEF